MSHLAHHTPPHQAALQFLALESMGRFAQELQAAGFDVTLAPSGSLRKRWKWLTGFFREQAFDVVHTHNTYPAIHATYPARWAGARLVVNTRHGQRIGHGWKSRWLFRLAAYGMDQLITVSHDAAAISRDVDGIRSTPIETIWNGIDLDAFGFQERDPRPIAIATGRLAPEKDLATMIAGIALAKPRVPDLQLHLVGGGKEEASLRQLVRQLQAAEYIHFWGEQQDVPSHLARAGFLISTSLSEGLSLTLLEAMAAGLPVIATDVGGNREILGESPFLIPAKSPTKLASAIEELWAIRDQWNLLALLGRQRVESHFDAKHMAQAYLTKYHQLLGRKQPSASRHSIGR